MLDTASLPDNVAAAIRETLGWEEDTYGGGWNTRLATLGLQQAQTAYLDHLGLSEEAHAIIVGLEAIRVAVEAASKTQSTTLVEDHGYDGMYPRHAG